MFISQQALPEAWGRRRLRQALPSSREPGRRSAGRSTNTKARTKAPVDDDGGKKHVPPPKGLDLERSELRKTLRVAPSHSGHAASPHASGRGSGPGLTAQAAPTLLALDVNVSCDTSALFLWLEKSRPSCKKRGRLLVRRETGKRISQIGITTEMKN